MKAADFDKLVDERIEKIRSTLQIKGKEYASATDRLHSFKRGGWVLDKTPEQVCVFYFTKHLVSLLDIVDADKAVPHAVIDEKVGDLVNYLILLEALLKERLS